MTLKELLECTVCDVGLSFCEDPTGREPEITFKMQNGTYSERDVLHKDFLNHKVHLIDVTHGMIHATIWDGDME